MVVDHHTNAGPNGGRYYPMRLMTMFTSGAGLSLLIVGFILMLIGIGTDVWSTKRVELDDADNL